MKRNIVALGLIGLALIGVLLLGNMVLNPATPADQRAITAANELYAAGHYTEAATIYEGFIEQGVEDADLYYNLANAYFQQGDLGRAILNYQRAAQLAPRDADIQANLALAQQQVVNPLPDAGSNAAAIIANSTGWLTLNETALLALALWFGFGFLVVAARRAQSDKVRRGLRNSAVILGVVLLFVTISLGSRTLMQSNRPSGVIVVPTVAVSNGPGAEFASNYNLTSGTEVNLIRTQGDWAELALPDGAGEGWVPRQAIEPLTTAFPEESAL